MEPDDTFTPAELAAHRAAAARGETPSFSIVAKFIRTIRKTFLASPIAMEKGKKTRNKKPVINEDQIDFF